MTSAIVAVETASREPQRTFPLTSPRSGVVVQKLVLDGMYVDPSAELYTVDTSSERSG